MANILLFGVAQQILSELDFSQNESELFKPTCTILPFLAEP